MEGVTTLFFTKTHKQKPDPPHGGWSWMEHSLRKQMGSKVGWEAGPTVFMGKLEKFLTVNC